MDFFENYGIIQDFPDELLLEIFQYMSVEELVTCIQKVCLRWRNISQNSPWLWKNLVYKPKSSISEEEIIDQLKEMPQLRTLVFNPDCAKLDEIINVLCSHCQYLKTLICDGFGVSTSHLQKMVTSLHDLEWFQLSPCHMIDNTSISLLNQFKNLRKLTGVNVGPTSAFIRENNEVFKSLEHLEIIAYCSYDGGFFYEDELSVLNPYHFLHLVPHLENLKHLFIDFRMIHFAGFETFFYNLKKLHYLETLCFKSFFHADKDILTKMFELSSFPKLRKIDLSSCLNISEFTLIAMNKSCPVVQELHFSHCVHFNDECLETLTMFPELLSLDISCCNGISIGGLLFLPRCSKLKVLDLSWRTNVGSDTLSTLSSIPHLQRLILNHTRVKAEDILVFLSQARNLVYLGLYYCKGVDGSSFHDVLPICRINQNHIDEVICQYSKILRES